ncbi:MAG: 3-hydroxyacyl-CoA dehydrogenase family protein [Deltaproteobacteria bacterium]|nr:3-hydroxyacyl-CoA dehydrogenase family protein [Deltaproteobacteria bacterium]
MERHIATVGILGTGTIGASWATFFASKGLQVKMYDIAAPVLSSGYEKALSNLEAMADFGLIDRSGLPAMKEAIRTCISQDELAIGSDYIQESVAETYEVKRIVYRGLDKAASAEAILASSSSGLLMSEIQKACSRPERCLIAHPFNPPHLVPLVELVPGAATDPAIISWAKGFFESLDKIPVVLKKEAPGHIANRLASALWREAIDLVQKGVASVEDVDKALFAGPGIRWAFMGQHLIYHLGGGETGGMGYFIDHVGKAFGAYWKEMATWSEISPETRQMLIDGVTEEMGDRTFKEIAQWRDSKLVELLKIIYSAKK